MLASSQANKHKWLIPHHHKVTLYWFLLLKGYKIKDPQAITPEKDSFVFFFPIKNIEISYLLIVFYSVSIVLYKINISIFIIILSMKSFVAFHIIVTTFIFYHSVLRTCLKCISICCNHICNLPRLKLLATLMSQS